FYFDGIEQISYHLDENETIKKSFPDSTNRWLAPNLSLRVSEWKPVDEQELPDTLLVDYIKVFQKNK
ncbi:MAG: hypothetical protein AAGK97_11600, partial [Bacteroidota bacterium]